MNLTRPRAPLAPLARLALLTLLALPGCEDDRTQVCAPGRPDRCPAGQTCNVDSTGTPRCTTPGDALEGALCRVAPTGDDADADADSNASNRCADGLGCLRIAGVSRCLRFCDPAARQDPCRPAGNIAVGPGGVRLSDFARCAALLPDRPEIGVCVLPCRPERAPGCDPIPDPAACAAHPDDCPEATTCGVTPAAPFPLCVPAGDAPLDAPCDPATPCAPGLICARLDGTAACRLPVDLTDACPSGLIPSPLAGTDDAFADTVQQVCLP